MPAVLEQKTQTLPASSEVQHFPKRNSVSIRRYFESSHKRLVRNILRDNLTPEMDHKLRRIIRNIAFDAYFTTFTDDYDFTSEGIGLDQLADYPREHAERLFDSLRENAPNMFVSRYIEKFEEKYCH